MKRPSDSTALLFAKSCDLISTLESQSLGLNRARFFRVISLLTKAPKSNSTGKQYAHRHKSTRALACLLELCAVPVFLLS